MYPVLFRIGSFEITSFGVMVALGSLVGYWIFSRELRRSGFPASASDAALYGILGGLLGAKLLWLGEHVSEEPFLNLLSSRGGMSWFGGFTGGVAAGVSVMLVRRLPIVPILAAATPGFAFGQLIGRIGCFLVGDDYGRPSTLPWAVAFPQGLPPTDVPVHPTQIYEAICLSVLGWLLFRWRREGVSDRQVLGRYLLIAGGVRFTIEFIRINERVLWGLSVAQIVSLLLVGVGAVMVAMPPRNGDTIGERGTREALAHASAGAIQSKR